MTPPVAALGRRIPPLLALALGILTLLVSVGVVAPRTTVRAARDDVNIMVGEPATLDPARAGDAASAAVTAQLFETLTAFDPGLALRPALASSWDVTDGGRRVVFHLRPALTFSDGSPLGAGDVVRSWLRIIDPASPSPLSALAMDVEGAAAYARGDSRDPSSVGLEASGDDVVVRLVRPTDFASVVASPTFGIVPASIDANPPGQGGTFAGSGGYLLAQKTATALVLTANDRYWAGRPAIGTVRLVYDIGGRSPVEVFAAGEVDYAPISPYDASWIAWDRDLGPRLVANPELTTDYYGFDTSRPPFDDVRVRRAFALAVDWRRIVDLGAVDGDQVPATGMVPPGIPGRGSGDFSPAHDPVEARRLLAAAGFPAGKGFPSIALVSGSSSDEAVVAEIHAVLGIDVRLERMESGQYFDRLSADPPAFWSLSWIADYPSPNDFLGILLGTGSSSNYSRWSSPEFDRAIGSAIAAPDAASAVAAYDAAQAVVQRDVPVIPMSYSGGSVLLREGLLGAVENGLGFLRLAGLAWADR